MGFDIITTLVFLWPGMICMFVCNGLAGDDGSRTDFEKTILGLALSLPTLCLTYVILRLTSFGISILYGVEWQMSTLKGLSEWMQPLDHLMYYMIVSLLCSLIVGVMITSQTMKGSIGLEAWNWMRGKVGRAAKDGYATVWDGLLDNKKNQIVGVVVGDREYRGYAKNVSTGGQKNREIVITNTQDIEQYEDYLSKISRVYAHLESGSTIIFYDMTELEEHARSKGYSPK